MSQTKTETIAQLVSDTSYSSDKAGQRSEIIDTNIFLDNTTPEASQGQSGLFVSGNKAISLSRAENFAQPTSEDDYFRVMKDGHVEKVTGIGQLTKVCPYMAELALSNSLDQVEKLARLMSLGYSASHSKPKIATDTIKVADKIVENNPNKNEVKVKRNDINVPLTVRLPNFRPIESIIRTDLINQTESKINVVDKKTSSKKKTNEIKLKAKDLKKSLKKVLFLSKKKIDNKEPLVLVSKLKVENETPVTIKTNKQPKREFIKTILKSGGQIKPLTKQIELSPEITLSNEVIGQIFDDTGSITEQSDRINQVMRQQSEVVIEDNSHEAIEARFNEIENKISGEPEITLSNEVIGQIFNNRAVVIEHRNNVKEKELYQSDQDIKVELDKFYKETFSEEVKLSLNILPVLVNEFKNKTEVLRIINTESVPFDQAKVLLKIDRIIEKFEEFNKNNILRDKKAEINLFEDCVKLIKLLGIENGRELMIEFIENYGFDFFIKNIKYFRLLINEQYRREFKIKSLDNDFKTSNSKYSTIYNWLLTLVTFFDPIIELD